VTPGQRLASGEPDLASIAAAMGRMD